jgi:subtilisin family serine protease
MRLRSLAVLAGLAALVVGAVLMLPSGGGGAASIAPSRTEEAARWSGLVGGPRARVAVGERVLVVLSAFSLADRVQRAGGLAGDGDERRWTAAAFAAQQQFIADLGRLGVRIRPDYRYTRTINGFSALLDARAIALLERTRGVKGVYPVRVAYPASVSSRLLGKDVDVQPPVALGGYTGRGVTVALLDTGVDLHKPYLHGHVLDGVDVIGDGATARARAHPDDTTQIERHGTETAGLLVGFGGPGGLRGIAPGATVFPVRVAGWQPDFRDGHAVYARSDQILAGLERAVDPNGDGDAHDASRIALIALGEPFAAFADAPLARAAAGALELDTLVIAAAGNDGPAGPTFGSVSGPAGAPAALSVGTLDARLRRTDVRAVARVGLRVVLDRTLPLANAVPPQRTLVLAPAVPRANGATAADYFDRSGLSLVAGRAALAPAGGDPAAAARFAARAGARAVLLHGQDLPPGSLGLDEEVDVPVVALPERAAAELLAAVRRGSNVEITLARPHETTELRRARVAAFASWGLAFDGGVKPELVAPGVGLPTAAPGRNEDGTAAFATVNGASAAAAVVAGAAALLAQARPELSADELRSVLVGAAQPVAASPLPAQGAGALDLGRAVAAEVAAEPATVTFGRGEGDGWQGRRELQLRNLSSRRLTLFIGTGQGPRPRVAVEVSPRRLELDPGRAGRITVTARIVGFPRGEAASGALTVTALGGATLRVPWSLVLTAGRGSLLGPLELSARSFRPSERGSAVVTVRVGQVRRAPRGNELRPALRLDVELLTKSGKRLGLLARVRDLLPGRYAFGLTGRGPNGKVLPRGVYRLRLVAWPTGGGAPSPRSTTFTIR